MIPFSLFGLTRHISFIRTILGIVIVLVVLKYAFHINILDFFHNGNFNPYFDKAYKTVQGIWDSTLHPWSDAAVKYALIAWDFIMKYWLIVWNKAVYIGSKFLHTVPS